MFRQGQKLYLVSEHLLIEKWTSKIQFLCIVAKGQMYRNIYIYIYIISILHFLILGSPSFLDTGRALHLGRLLAGEGSFNIPFSMTFTKLTELFGHSNTGFPCQKKNIISVDEVLDLDGLSGVLYRQKTKLSLISELWSRTCRESNFQISSLLVPPHTNCSIWVNLRNFR